MSEWAIWSNERRAFWRQNRRGYISNLADAGRFSIDEARAICAAASAGGILSVTTESGHQMPPEIMILAPRRRTRPDPKMLAREAVALFTGSRDFPGNERLCQIIAQTIEFDREHLS